MTSRFAACLAVLTVLSVAAVAAAAPRDTPTVSVDVVGHAKVRLTITAGASGAPDGVGVYWMTAQDYYDYGEVWPTTLSYPGFGWAFFSGTPSLNTFDGAVTTFQLAPFQTIQVEIGDLEGETGLTTNVPDELSTDTDYVLCTFAEGGAGGQRSAYSLNVGCHPHNQGEHCTFTQGYWKNHPNAWPVSSLKLGNVTYTKAQLLQILNQPTQGNGLVSMARQLIATKLNIANGASAAPIAATVAAADAQIGNLVVPPIGAGYLSPGSTSSKTQKLDAFNNDDDHQEKCASVPAGTDTWGRVKSLYR